MPDCRCRLISGPTSFCRKIQRVIGAEVYWKSTDGLALGKSAGKDCCAYNVNSITGALTSTETIAAGSHPVIHPSGKFAYVVNSGSNDVSTYSVDSTTGALASTGTIAAGSDPTSIAIHPSGKFAYVTNSGSNDVWAYSVDTAAGALALIGSTGT